MWKPWPLDPDVKAQLLDQSPIFDIVHRQAIEDMIVRPDLPNSESKFLFYFLCSKIFLEEQAQQTVIPSSSDLISTIGEAQEVKVA